MAGRALECNCGSADSGRAKPSTATQVHRTAACLGRMVWLRTFALLSAIRYVDIREAHINGEKSLISCVY